MSQIYLGQIVHCKVFGELELIVDGFLVVQNGKIIDIGERNKSILEKYAASEHIVLEATQFLMPGFIDCHIHAPQMPNIGLGLDKDLLGWLNAYTFPLEAQYTDLKFAASVYKKVVARTLSFGSTCASYFGTNDCNATKLLVDEVILQGQRALVGKVSSNTCCPDYYVENTDDSIRDNIKFIEYVVALKNDLVKPTITPRFALSCDKNLMNNLAILASKHDLHIQTHLSENVGEVEFVNQTYPEDGTYTNVYDSVNLLTKKTIMAHSIHLDTEEIKILKKRGTSVAHCPASNINLGSGICDVRRLMQHGVIVGLGTDVAGGNKVSILDALRTALDVSHTLEFIKKQNIKGTGKIDDVTGENSKYVPLNYKEAFYLATLGGAQALVLEDKIGNFDIGKDFDALLIDINCSPIDQYDLPDKLKNKTGDEQLLSYIEKFLYVGDDRNILKVFVNGRQVKK